MPVPDPSFVGSRRALATIVFTDVVSYSAHMGQDEERALAAVKRDFALMRTLCEQHEGWAVKEIGDALMMHFSSAVQAVECAQAIQKAIVVQARQLPPDSLILQHRIGMHLGDVVIDADDVRGDGVNIAARVQGAAEPDTVYLSQAVRDAIPTRYRERAIAVGHRSLKNIDTPVMIYAFPALTAAPLATPAKPLTGTTTETQMGQRLGALWLGLPLLGVIAIATWQGWGVLQLQEAEAALVAGTWDQPIPDLPRWHFRGAQAAQLRQQQAQWRTTLATLERETLPDVPRFPAQSPFAALATTLQAEVAALEAADLAIATNLRPGDLYDSALPSLLNQDWQYISEALIDQRISTMVSRQLSDVYRTYTLTQAEIDRGERPPFRFAIDHWAAGDMYVEASIVNLPERTDEKYQLATFIFSVVLLADALPTPLPPRLGIPKTMHIHFYEGETFQVATTIDDIEAMRFAIANQSASLNDLLATIPVATSPQW